MRLGNFLPVPLLLLLLCSCLGPNYDSKVSEAIAAQVKQHKAPVKVAELTDFKWEKLYTFGPYTPQEDVDRALRFAWPDYDSTGLNVSDQFSLLVFVAEGKVVRVSKYPAIQGRFSQTTHEGYPPHKAVFEATVESGGITVLKSIYEPKQPKFWVEDGLSPGIYEVKAWVLAPQPGQAFLKVFDSKTNRLLSADRMAKPSTKSLAWHGAKSKALSPYDATVTIYEGDWDHQYEARFELWHRSAKGKEQRLISTTRMVNGWER
jgi:hypothetical protein